MTTPRVVGPITLAIDIGGTGLKAAALDKAGKMLTDRLRIPTPYPLAPASLVQHLHQLAAPIKRFDRVSVGFPGMVRNGLILSAPHLVLAKGPGSKVDPNLVHAYHRFDLADALAEAFGKPTRVVNDADLQGLDVASGNGLEVAITLGTGFGTAVLHDGQLAPHMEMSQLPFRNGETYDEQLGDAARKRIGATRWSKRVHKAIAILDTLLIFDHLYIGGGNEGRVKGALGPKVSTIDPNAGLLGGIRLWEQTSMAPR
jgi:polyphosphate glucokinase